jgi:hypothetical protein
MNLRFIKNHVRFFYLLVLLLMVSATLYHGLVFYFFDIDYYYHVQNLSFNILFIIFIAFCYKKVLNKSDITFIGLNLFILLIFILQLEISLCDYLNFYSYYWSSEIMFLQVEHMSALEQYLIPLGSSLIEAFSARCLENEIIKNVPVLSAELSINGKKYAGKATLAIEVIQGVSLGLALPKPLKITGSASPKDTP